MRFSFRGMFAFVLLLSAPRFAGADLIGPGDISATAVDAAFDILAVDLNSPVTLAQGNYTASVFNFQFSVLAGVPTGTITPVLLTGGGTSFTPVAVGSTITYTGPTAFNSVAFGGANAFTLASSTVVYGGLYWETTEQGVDERMPVGYADVGNSYVFFGGGTGAGAVPPVVGVPSSATGQGFFVRTYDFSIQADLNASVPEPSSVILTFITASLFGAGSFRQRRPKQTMASSPS